jgi:hypothetical protein
MGSKGHTAPLKLGIWTRIIGWYSLLPADHPVSRILAAAGLGEPSPAMAALAINHSPTSAIGGRGF